MDFSTGFLSKSFVYKRFHSDCANTSICDRYGKLQFYSNGCVISNRNHEMMDNGEIHVGYYTNGFCADSSLYYSNAVPQSILALPNFKYDSLYFVINRKLDAPSGFNATIGTKLYLNVVDMRKNQGLGQVVLKHLEILTDTTECEGLQAVPHANGRDWWVITPKFRSNCYFVIYLDAEGNTTVTEQCLGTEYGPEYWLGQSTFSPDGNKFVRFHWKYKLNIFDFDRCTGMLSNAQAISFPDIEFFRAGCAFSRSSRYLYTTTHTKLFQFDMQAPDIAASRTFIADWDGFNTPFNTKFYMANLALDGKVYVGCPGQHKHIHVVNEPELPGTACDSQQHSIELFTSNFWSFPNQAHTRLGPLDGSACDTLGINNVPWAFFRWDQKDTLSPLEVLFVELAAYIPTTWHWDFGDGITSTEQNPLHQYDSAGIYQVCLTVSNQYGSDTNCRTLYLGVTGTGEAASQVPVQVSPNPFCSHLSVAVSSPQVQGGMFRLYDQVGRLVREHRLAFGITEVETAALPPGMYFYSIEARGEVVKSGKLVKIERE